MEYKEFTAKTVSEAITDACQEFGVTSDRLVYEVIEKESAGFLGIGSKPATIKAAIKVEEEVKPTEAPKKEKNEKESPASFEECAKTFLRDVFDAMKMEVAIVAKFNEEERNLDIELSGDDMGMLIGKRGATLDSLQYLVSLVVNKNTDDYVRVKVDTENYRERRKETLENLAKNIAYKVKRTKRPVSLEPMNPYERRIIHSALQNDKYVTTHSEGEDPFRRVIVSLKK
ncbi:MAG: protein jag [Lachnospiraceae bacterium]|nr:protein jag [Lachnospiraceae bacterium]MBR4606969.1 protein jag [Lachnospiraceae bacterium]MBR6151951.1 protein jag [Lachnospiraceae bacterium]